jgi:hypothetical protein
MHAWAARLDLGDDDDGDEQHAVCGFVRPTAPVRRRLFSAASNDEYIYIAHET